jgi:glycosyltransferase involved in cell wall biosynthesis
MPSCDQPFFSVLIPSYNRPESIARCIDSVLANQQEDVEIIISDDASPQAEAIFTAIRPYLNLSYIQFHQQQTNIGEPANRNFLVAQATGRYNIILCDDDRLLPHSLRTLRNYIQRQPDHDLYTFGYRVMDESDITWYERVAPKAFPISLDQPQLVRRMFEGSWLPFLVFHPATFCCKKGIEKGIPYRQDVSTADDYMFLLECLNAGKRIFALPECLMSYRWIQDTTRTKQTNQSSDTMKVLKAYTKVYYALQRKADMHPSLSDFIYGYGYRKRFLYDLIINRMNINGETAALLKLEQPHFKELVRYGTTLKIRMAVLRLSLKTTYELTQQFRLRGIWYAIKVGVAYLNYQILRQSRKYPSEKSLGIHQIKLGS